MNHLIFLHIPKNAGTTLHSLLECNWSPHRTFHIKAPRSKSLQRLRSLNLGRKRHLKYVKGHQPFGTHMWFDNSEEWRYFTLLRDPVRRVVSEITYIRRHHPGLLPAGISDLDAVNNYSVFHNAQTRFIAGENVGLDDGTKNRSLNIDKSFRLSNLHLDQKFIYVGLVEDFDKSVNDLTNIIGLNYTKYQNRNESRAKKNMIVDPELESLILTHNEYDQAIYRRAMEGAWGYKSNCSASIPRMEASMVDRLYMTYRRIICRFVWSLR